jgi:hypothetical protein
MVLFPISAATREWGRQSRLAQGLPEKVEDPVAIEQVAALFRSVQPTTVLSPSRSTTGVPAADAGPAVPASWGAGRSHDTRDSAAARDEDISVRTATEPGDARAHVA